MEVIHPPGLISVNKNVTNGRVCFDGIIDGKNIGNINLTGDMENFLAGTGISASALDADKNYMGVLIIHIYNKDYQGQGLGRLMWSYAANDLLENGYEYLISTVSKNNERSQELHKRFGGEIIGNYWEFKTPKDVYLTDLSKVPQIHEGIVIPASSPEQTLL